MATSSMVENPPAEVDESSTASSAKSSEGGLAEWFGEQRNAFPDLSMKD
jgi:hypothetical protein